MSTRYQEKLVALEDDTLDPRDFSHQDHIGAAFLAIRKYGVFDAMSIFARGLVSLTERAGVPEKFNATITMASMSLIAERAATGDYRDADAFLSANNDLLSIAFLTRQYDPDRLSSALARSVPLLPKSQAA
ncbi:MAG: hypothetical protein ACR2O1_05110 [Boseongicola sp.]